MKLFKRLYSRVENAYETAEDAGLIGDRKSAFISAELTSLSGEVLVYKKSMLNEVHRGDTSIVAGYRVVETIKNPKNKLDGFVVCATL